MRFDVVVNYHKVKGGMIKIDSVSAPFQGDVEEVAGNTGFEEYSRGDCTMTHDAGGVSFYSPLFGQYFLTDTPPGDEDTFEVVKEIIRSGQERLSKIIGQPAKAVFVENPS